MDSRVQFNGLLNHVRRIVAGAEMFDPRSRRKIITKADHLWVELRKAIKAQVLRELQREDARSDKARPRR